MNDLLRLGLLLVLTSNAFAQVFSHETAGKRIEAEVTLDTLSLKERGEARSSTADLVCPLGPAVRANVVPGSAGASRVCLVFSREKCTHTGGGAAKAPSDPRASRGASAFKCIDLASAQQADALAALVNAGPQQPSPGVLVRPPASAPAPRASQEDKPLPKPEKPPAAKLDKETRRSSSAVAQHPAAVPSSGDGTARPVAVSANALVAQPVQKPPAAASHTQPAALTDKRVAEVPKRAKPEPALANGRWVMSRFMVKAWGNERLAEKTYAIASIVDESGAARTKGGHLYIRNESGKYPLYYGLRQAASERLEPGEEITLRVENKATGEPSVTRQLVTLRWFDEEASSTSRSRD
ncbi:MAG: hypothetical protein ACXW2A_00690 [Burkholderiales bacterium]